MSRDKLHKRNRNWLFGYRILFALIVPVFILVLLPQVAESQIVRKTPPIVTKTPPVVPTKRLIFEGRGVVPGGATNIPLTSDLSRKPITMEAKKAALMDAMIASSITVNANNIPVAKYAILNAQTMLVENRASFVIQGRVSIFPTVPKFRIDEGDLRIYLKPEKIDDWFLVDCSVFGYGSGSLINFPYEITGPDGNKMTFNNNGDDHLQMFMIAKSLEWQQFFIKRKGSYEVLSCEVTRAGK